MGIDLGDLASAQPRTLQSFKGAKVAIDAFNALYQFLATNRQPDGTPLTDERGRVTGHLSGVLFRTVNLLEAGILPCYVFDGEPHPRKRATLQLRSHVRQKATQEWRDALEEGDLERARSKAQQTSRLGGNEVSQAKTLLEHMGVPWVDAPSDGEGHASAMAISGVVDVVGSQDYDCLLYGAPRLARNLTLSGRRKLPRKNVFVAISPEEITLAHVLGHLELSREQLVDMAWFIGTDFNPGVRGIGPKKSLALLREHKTAEAVAKAKGWELDSAWLQDVRSIFLTMPVSSISHPRWRPLDRAAVERYLVDEFSFNQVRVGAALKRVGVAIESGAQTSLDSFA